jgi:hypothetical protein
MSVEQGIQQGRREAEKLMTTTCTIARNDGTTVDPDTLDDVTTWTQTYAGKCRVRRPGPSARDKQTAGQTITLQDLILSLPVTGSSRVITDHVVTVTANPLDPALVGVTFRVTGMHDETTATARRFPIERMS